MSRDASDAKIPAAVATGGEPWMDRGHQWTICAILQVAVAGVAAAGFALPSCPALQTWSFRRFTASGQVLRSSEFFLLPQMLPSAARAAGPLVLSLSAFFGCTESFIISVVICWNFDMQSHLVRLHLLEFSPGRRAGWT